MSEAVAGRAGTSRGRWAGLAGLAAVLVKGGAVLLKLKGLVTVVTMLVSVLAYAQLYGWRYGLGLVLLIAVHESGHVLELRRRGVPAGLPVFVPFVGAFVQLHRQPRSVADEAWSALAGPALGAAGALVVAGAAAATGSELLRALAFTGFLVNLFNLVPALPLDGGRAAAALHPAVWFAGTAGLLAYAVVSPHPVVLLVLVLGAVETVRRWRGRHRPGARAYLLLTARERVAVSCAFLGLATLLAVAAALAYVPRALS